MPLLHGSITEILEKNLVSRLMSDPHQRNNLLNIRGLMQGARVLEGIDHSRFRKELRGDVDMLVLPSAGQATAIQVKRFKMVLGDSSQHATLLGRMERLFDEGVEQANRDADLGFSQVYLWVFACIDSREQNGGRLTYDGPNSTISCAIDRIVSIQHLHPRVGLMHFDWVQPMDYPPFELGTSGGHLKRVAETVEQPADLTAWLGTL